MKASAGLELRMYGSQIRHFIQPAIELVNVAFDKILFIGQNVSIRGEPFCDVLFHLTALHFYKSEIYMYMHFQS